jgi:hypothetical protein
MLKACNTVLILGNGNGVLTRRSFNLLKSYGFVQYHSCLVFGFVYKKLRPILTLAAIRVPLTPKVF